MERRILLPTDFSDNSWSALVYALKLFKDEVCTFYLLHSTIITEPTMAYIPDKVWKNIHQESLRELTELKTMAEVANANANHSFCVLVSPKDLRNAIETTVNKYNIDLVVMATKGATGTKEFFFGTNTVHIINHMRKCPVLVVPEEFDFVAPRQIAFPTDFNRTYRDHELASIKQLAGLYNSKIRIVHINVEETLTDEQEYNIIVLKSYFKDNEHSFHWMPKYANKTIEINDFILELEIDILAMVNYRNSFIQKLLHEPVIKNIGYQPIVPFMAIPE